MGQGALTPSLTPPLKWAGGKRWLAKRHADLFPESFGTYYEPFLGGAAVFFHLAPETSVLSDANSDLIATYTALKSDWKTVKALLGVHAQHHSDAYFYERRADKPFDSAELAAWFLYMNRACYNGLYRVNRQGVFNVPRGSKDTILFPYDDFEGISKALQSAKLLHADFEISLNKAARGDFIYLDPPYTVRHNNNGFVKYNEEMFSWADQERLSKAVIRAANRGAKILISNADHSSVRDLYRNIGTTVQISRHSVIGGGSQYRSSTSEIIVKVGY